MCIDLQGQHSAGQHGCDVKVQRALFQCCCVMTVAGRCTCGTRTEQRHDPVRLAGSHLPYTVARSHAASAVHLPRGRHDMRILRQKPSPKGFWLFWGLRS